MQSTARSTVPIPVTTCYEMFLASAQEKKWKILSADAVNHVLKYQVSGNAMKFEAVFTSIPGDRAQMVLTANHSGAMDLSDQLTAYYIEPLLSLVNAKQRTEAEATLGSIKRDEIVFSSLPVTPEVEKLLSELQNGLSAFGRRDAAKALGALSETNVRIVAALLLARETDAHDAVRSSAAQVLQSPAMTAMLERNPDWVNRVLALSKITKAGAVQVEQQVRANNRSATAMIGSGFTFIIAGVIGLLLPLVGYQLIFRGIPTGQPIVAGVVALVGVILLVVGYRSRKQ